MNPLREWTSDAVKMYAKMKEFGPVGGRVPEIFVCKSTTLDPTNMIIHDSQLCRMLNNSPKTGQQFL